MPKPALYPLFLDLDDAPVLVVGGGEVAERKIAGLLESGARVLVVALSATPAIARSARKKALQLERRGFKLPDLRGKRLVFAATNNLALNRRIAKSCRARGIPVNVAAPPEAGDAQVPAMVRRGAFCLAVSTGGASAALARHWRKRLEKIAGPEWGELAGLLEPRRERVLREITDEAARVKLLRQLAAPRWAAVIKRQGAKAAAKAMDKLIGEAVACRPAAAQERGRPARKKNLPKNKTPLTSPRIA
jgi:siroheme synthase-like protein